jgi:hypothetical protein
VLAEGIVVGRIMKAAAAPVGTPWLYAFGHHEDRTPTHGYAATREAADGGVRQELAAGIGWSLINAQIAAGYPLTLRLRHLRYLVTGTSAYGRPKNRTHCYRRSGA